MIGSLVGGLLFFGYVGMLILTVIALPVVIGKLTLSLFGQANQKITSMVILFGAFITFLLLLLPLIGALVLLVLFIVTLGTIVSEVHKQFT
jgi:hypothetical protein